MQDKIDDQTSNDSQQEPKQSSIQIGGASSSYGFESDEDELMNVANQHPPRQTTVVGLSGGEDAEKQIEVIGPQYQAEKKERPKEYQSESQKIIAKETKKKNTALVVLALVIATVLVAAGYIAYRLIVQS